jgi:hypothetical protein
MAGTLLIAAVQPTHAARTLHTTAGTLSMHLPRRLLCPIRERDPPAATRFPTPQAHHLLNLGGCRGSPLRDASLQPAGKVEG